MNRRIWKLGWLTTLLLGLGTVVATPAQAVVEGVTGTTFNITTSRAYIPTPDGGSLLVWGYGVEGGLPQYPGPSS